jgi:SecD/SecF fusion protein
MGFYYNKAGWVADLALFANVFFVVGVLTSLGAVLTLPGIAGIVLTIGMSVDANILIFERVREELHHGGKNIKNGIADGFSHAMSSILDSNITTLLLGIILYIFGTGPIQGFATTLIIGIISSMFCAIFITRLMFDYLLEKNSVITFWTKATENTFKNININFVGNRMRYYMFSGVIIAMGVVFFFINHGFHFGVDFKGGRMYVVRFEKAMETETIKTNLRESLGDAPDVKTYGSDFDQKITTSYLIEDQAEDAEQKVQAALKAGLDKTGVKYEIISSNKVGETVSADIKSKALYAIIFSCILMFVYILVRFKKWQYGLGAVAALVHDVLVVLSCYVIFENIMPFSLEINQDFIAAILTVMGYSMTDTVVVFDRIREYLTIRNKTELDPEERNEVINNALNTTLSRTINTSLTIFFVILSIFIFGGDTIRGFSFALLIGIVIGTYSSICIATPVVIDFDKTSKK